MVQADNSVIYYNLGAAYSNNEDFKQATIEYLKAVRLEPTMGDAYNGLAFTFYKLKDYELAAEYIIKAEELDIEINKDLLKAIESELQ